MKTIFLLVLFLGSQGFSGAALFDSRGIMQSELSQKEARIFDAVQNKRGAKNAKLMRVDSSAFSRGALDIDFFDGLTGSFTVTKISKEDGDSVWRGTIENDKHERNEAFCLRKRGGRYSGYIIYGGHNYTLTPISKGLSMLIDEDLKSTCGFKDVPKNREKTK